MTKLFIFLSIHCLYFHVCTAQSIINLNNNPDKNIGQQIGFKEDKTGALTFKEIYALPDTDFKLGKNEVFNGGTLGKTWWMKLKYTNSKNITPYLIFEYGNIDYLDIYYTNTNNQITHLESGTFADKDSRAFVSTEYIFQLKDVSGDVKEIYIRAKAVNTLIAPIKLLSGINLAKKLINKYIWQLLFVGIALSLFIFNLFMLISSGDKKHGLYMIRIFFLFYIYILAYLNGYAHFFNTEASKFILIHAHAFAAIGFIATILFNNAFLDIKTNMPRLIKWFNILIALWVIIFFLSLWDFRSITNRIAQVLVFVSSSAIIYTSIRALQLKIGSRKGRYMVFYFLGWLPISISTVYVVLTLINVLPVKDYTFTTVTTAGVIEAILISLALLGDRINFLRRGKEIAEQKSIDLIRERNAYLEQKIEERTKELQLANVQLQNSGDFKVKLFSIIAHDMRSPLSALKLVLQMADRDMLDADNLSKFLTNIRKSTEQVQNMMDNLLNWAISQMKLQINEPENIDIIKFLKDQFGLYETLAQAKKINISFITADNLIISADKNQLSLIFRNLMDNAIKFTPIDGFIEIGLKKENSKNTLYILNSGELITQSTIDRILGDDQNILMSSYGTSQEKGTGLGLQLCKEFIKNFNSELKIGHVTHNNIPCTIFYFEILEIS